MRFMKAMLMTVATAAMLLGCSTTNTTAVNNTLTQINTDLKTYCPAGMAAMGALEVSMTSVSPTAQASFTQLNTTLTQVCTNGVTLTDISQWTPAKLQADVAAFDSIVDATHLAVSVKTDAKALAGAFGGAMTAALMQIPTSAPVTVPAPAPITKTN